MKERKHTFKSWDGLEMTTYHYPSQGSDQLIIFTHGISEYARRHNYLVKLLTSHYHLVLYDIRGHGHSLAPKGYVESFSDYEKDLARIIEYFRKKEGFKKIHLFGHSMGGLITLAYHHRFSSNRDIQSLFLSAPALGVGDWLGHFLQENCPPQFFHFAGKVLQKIPIRGSVDARLLSHDPRVQESYGADPLMLKKLKAQTVLELLARGQELMQQNYPDRTPLKIVVGSDDKIISPDRILLYAKKNKLSPSINLIEGALHEMHFEIEPYRSQYIASICDFYKLPPYALVDKGGHKFSQ